MSKVRELAEKILRHSERATLLMAGDFERIIRAEIEELLSAAEDAGKMCEEDDNCYACVLAAIVRDWRQR